MRKTAVSSQRNRGDYGFARARDLAFDAVRALWDKRQQSGMRQIDVANAIGRDPAWVNRALRGPGNWTLRTIGELIEALSGELEISAHAIEAKVYPTPNYDAICWRDTGAIGMKSSRKYGPIETENERVEVADAETPEAKADAHGMAALKRKRGGKVEGDKPRMRLDRAHRARGGHVKGKAKTTVNVIIAPQGGDKPGVMPIPVPPPGAGPGPMMRPPMAAPPIAPPGMGAPAGMPPVLGRKDGGRTPYPKMTAGALSGEGRLEKVEKYGKRAKESEGR